MTKVICTVDKIQPLTSGVHQVLLTPQQKVEFKAGQYLQLCLTEQDKRPFSVASIPGQTQLELQIHQYYPGYINTPVFHCPISRACLMC